MQEKSEKIGCRLRNNSLNEKISNYEVAFRVQI